MKIILTLTLLLSLNVFADPIILEIGGIKHSCSPVMNPGNPSDCSNRAYSGPFNREESIALCTGAMNVAPAECGIKAYNGPFSKPEAIQICSRALTSGPADCAIMAYNGPFSKPEAIQLCSNNSTVENARCAINAYNGPYSKPEAIKLCQGRMMKNKSFLSMSKDKFEKILIQANLKAMENGEYKN